MSSNLRPGSFFVLSLLLLPSGAARAEGAAVEINATRALAGGVTPGDLPGYPVTISQPGSYRLTGPLTQPDASTRVLDITANGGVVTLDLGGFGLQGSNSCQVSAEGTITCPQTTDKPGAGAGIGSNGNSALVVHDGAIDGMAGDGIAVIGSRPARIARVMVFNSGRNGIALAGELSVITDCTIDRAAAGGIVVAERSIVTGNTINATNSNSIMAEDGSIVDGNAVSSSRMTCIQCLNGCQIKENTIFSCKNYGIWSEGSRVVDNNIRRTAKGMHLGGSSASGGNLIQESSVGAFDAGFRGFPLAPDGCGTGTAPAGTCP
ncbi:MAG: right-handed parallel beta-helix repeat-containing protein [Myxococcota bacterium]|nr:right-handed parallel beta-helix repeat-containing protein [Myxococcota bacterium]